MLICSSTTFGLKKKKNFFFAPRCCFLVLLTPTRVNKPAVRPGTGADLPEGEVIYLLLVLAAGAEIISSPAPAGARRGPPRPGGGR